MSFSKEIFEKLARRMKADWDRRVRYDYRLWIANSLDKNAELLEEGKRDFEFFRSRAVQTNQRRALNIGCGVGRMLPAANDIFEEVIGCDISAEAIGKAQVVVSEHASVSVLCNSGFDLDTVADRSIDFVWSFAAMPHMPTCIFASYLREARRVLADDGCMQVQLFIGEQDPPHAFDTLRMRAYRVDALENAFALAGLQILNIEPIALPLDELLTELGIQPVLISAKRGAEPSQTIESIADALLLGQAEHYDESAPCADFEAWLATHYADRLHSDGDFERARNALEYVMQHCKTATIDIRDILQRLDELSLKSGGLSLKEDIYLSNMECLKDKFPEVHAKLSRHNQLSNLRTVRVSGSNDGPVLWVGKTCLDHADKPILAAQSWVKRACHDEALQQCQELVVVGFGGGYHLEVLLEQSSKRVSCIEPDIEILHTALSSRDLRSVLCSLQTLTIYDQEEDANLPDEEAELLIRPQLVAIQGSRVKEIQQAFYGKRGIKALRPRIAVLGPLQGGTLSIGEYTTNALTNVGQSVRGIDMSGFNDSYMLISSLIRDEFKQKAARQMYVETLSTFLLESVTERPIDILICMAQAPTSPQLLLELRRRGIITVLWFVEDYLRFTYWKEIAQCFDYIFTIQKGECIEQLRKAGAGEVHYLPTACHPVVHAPVVLTEEERQRWGSPLSFVGAGYYNRQQMFASLSHYPLKIWGTEWPTGRPFDRLVQESGRRLKPEEYVKIFNATDININLHSSSERDGVDPTGDFVNPRTFELSAAGAFQLVDERSLLADCFVPGEEIITFSSESELRQKIDYYLEHPEEREAIANRGRERALRDHTYEKRLEQMLSIIYAGSYKRLHDRKVCNPWTEMIERTSFDPELQKRCETARDRGDEPVLDHLVSSIAMGKGALSETEQKLLFLHHVKKQISRMEKGGAGVKNG